MQIYCVLCHRQERVHGFRSNKSDGIIEPGDRYSCLSHLGIAKCFRPKKSESATDDTVIQPGDHVRIPLCCRLPCFSHHGIVKEVSEVPAQSKAVELEVIEIKRSGSNPFRNCCNKLFHENQSPVEDKIGIVVKHKDQPFKDSPRDVLCCCKFTLTSSTWQINDETTESCFSRKLENKTDKNQSSTDTEKEKMAVKFRDIKKIAYYRRRYSHTQTIARANSFLPKEDATEPERFNYKLMSRNCEHFSVAMVAGEQIYGEEFDGGEAKISYEGITSLQVYKSYWFFIHFIISVLQFGSYILNFYVYAVFAEGDESYNHFFGNTSTSPLKGCYIGYSVHGFATVCDWYCLVGFFVIYCIGYSRLLSVQQDMYKYICNQCRVAERIVYGTKMISYVVIEIVFILSEKVLYKLLECIKSDWPVTIVFIGMFAFLQFFCAIWLVPKIALMCIQECECLQRGCCCYPKCTYPACCLWWFCCPWKFDGESAKYVFHHV